MKLSADLLKEFAKATNDSSKERVAGIVDGTAVIHDTEAWVQIDGSDTLTPIKMTAAARDGDRVRVEIKDHQATIVGNYTSPAASIGALEDLSGLVDEQGNVIEGIGNNIQLINNNINLMNNEIEMQGNFITAHDNAINAIGNDIVAIDNDLVAKGNQITALNNTIDTMDTTLTSHGASITLLDTNLEEVRSDVSVQDSQIGILNSAFTIEGGHVRGLKSIVVDDFASRFAEIQNGHIDTALIEDGSISDAKINNISANKLTSGEINGDLVRVYNLNAEYITAGYLNGQRLGTGTIDLTKLAEEVPTKEEYEAKIAELESEISGAIQTWTVSEIPTLYNYPAEDWTTVSERDSHVGDVAYVTNPDSEAAGYSYRFSKDSSGLFSWVLIQDSEITHILQHLLEVDGDISALQTFDTHVTSFMTETDEELSNLQTRTSTVETALGSKVNVTTFNTLSQKVETNTAQIETMSETTIPELEGDITTVSTKVNTVEQKADSNTASISSLSTTVQNNKTSIETRASSIEQNLSQYKTTVAATYATKDSLEDYAETTWVISQIDQREDSILLSVETSEAMLESSLTQYTLAQKQAAINVALDQISSMVSAGGGTATYRQTASGYEWVVDGLKGEKGDKGDKGDSGSTGTGITSTTVGYATSTSPTTRPTQWSTSIPSPITPGHYLWTRTAFLYSDGTTSYTYTTARQGQNGTNGTNGTNGRDGTNGRGISSTVEEYAWGNSLTAVPSSGWVSGRIPTPKTGNYLWTKTITTYTDGSTNNSYIVTQQGVDGAKGDKGDPGTNGTDGQDGKDGKGIANVVTTYTESTSGTTAPTTGWLSYIPTITPGRYLWTRTITTYTDGTSSVAYSVSRQGANGTNGTNGTNGRGIRSSEINYGVGTSGTSAPTSWYTYVPTVPSGQFLWTRVTITYTDLSSSTSYSVSKQGTDGAKGDKGDKGDAGANGTNGIGIKSTAIAYASGTSGTSAPTSGWQSSVPTVASGNYLWTRTTLTYTDNSTNVSYSAARQGVNGANGTNGTNGKDGTNGKNGRGIYSTTINYAVSTSGTSVPTSGWQSSIPSVPAGSYLWTRQDYLYDDVTHTYSYSVSKQGADGAKGADGKDGKDGNGISSTTINYATSTSGTTVPTSGWQTSIPTVAAGNYLWTRTVTNYTSGTSSTSYSVARNGTNGANGAKGDKGDSVTIRSTVVEYCKSSSRTAEPTSGWSTSIVEPTYAQPYLWTRVTVTYNDGTMTQACSISNTMASYSISSANILPDSRLFADWMLTNSGYVEVTTQINNEEIGDNMFYVSDSGSYRKIRSSYDYSTYTWVDCNAGRETTYSIALREPNSDVDPACKNSGIELYCNTTSTSTIQMGFNIGKYTSGHSTLANFGITKGESYCISAKFKLRMYNSSGNLDTGGVIVRVYGSTSSTGSSWTQIAYGYSTYIDTDADGWQNHKFEKYLSNMISTSSSYTYLTFVIQSVNYVRAKDSRIIMYEFKMENGAFPTPYEEGDGDWVRIKYSGSASSGQYGIYTTCGLDKPTTSEDYFTFSTICDSVSPSGNCCVKIEAEYTSSTNHQRVTSTVFTAYNLKDGLFTRTFSPPVGTKRLNVYLMTDVYYNNTAMFCHPQLERGTIATGWSEAAEDVRADIIKASKTADAYMDLGHYGNGLTISDLEHMKTTLSGERILGKNAFIDTEGFHIRDGLTDLAYFKAHEVSLGSGTATFTDRYVSLANGKAFFTYYPPSSGSTTNDSVTLMANTPYFTMQNTKGVEVGISDTSIYLDTPKGVMRYNDWNDGEWTSTIPIGVTKALNCATSGGDLQWFGASNANTRIFYNNTTQQVNIYINCSNTAAKSVGSALFLMPNSCRAYSIHNFCVYTTGGEAATCYVDMDGYVRCGTPIAAGKAVVGTVTYPTRNIKVG